MQMFFLGVAGWFSSILGSLNVIANDHPYAGQGMTPFRMPILFGLPSPHSIIADRYAVDQPVLSIGHVRTPVRDGFLRSIKGGNPVLFSIYSGLFPPCVYVFVLPGLGIISELLPFLPVSRSLATSGWRYHPLASFGWLLVWAHHMFTSGMAEYLRPPSCTAPPGGGANRCKIFS
jgi:cytochrome c oxidase subunit 1